MRTLREACKGIGRKPGRTALSVFGISMALVMFGVLGIITLGAHTFIDKLRKSEEISVYIADAATDAEMLTLDESIASMPGVESTRIVSKENAAQEFERIFGKNLLSTLEENPLPRSIVVIMAPKYRTAADFSIIASRIERLNGVESIEYGREWIKKMDTFFLLFIIGEIALIVLVSIAGILVVSGSIGLTVVARRGEIEVMRLVGATERFIRRPFYLEGVFQGLAAGIFAFCALYGTYLWVLGSVSDLEVYLRILGFRKDEFVSGGQYLAGIIPAGLLLGLLGSYIAVRRDV